MSKKIDNLYFSEKDPKSKTIDDIKKVSLDDLIPLLINILKRRGRDAHKSELEREIYTTFKSIVDTPRHQEIVLTGVTR